MQLIRKSYLRLTNLILVPGLPGPLSSETLEQEGKHNRQMLLLTVISISIIVIYPPNKTD